MLTETLLFVLLVFNLISFGIVFYSLWQYFLVMKDNVAAFALMVEFMTKNFQKNLEDHENIAKIIVDTDEKVVTTLTENDQKIVDMVSENQKNLVNLATFLGYRQRNLEDL